MHSGARPRFNHTVGVRRFLGESYDEKWTAITFIYLRNSLEPAEGLEVCFLTLLSSLGLLYFHR